MTRCIAFLLALFFAHSIQAATLLVWGDSLSAGYGVPAEKAWTSLLEQKLIREGYRYATINSSVSGETSAGGLNRFPPVLSRYKPAVVIIELGANDGLRGLPVASMQENLRAMIRQSKEAGAKVLLIGMRMPPNLGPVYTEQFSKTYTTLAKEQHVALVPFMMEGFADHKELFQADGIHPSAEAQTKVLDNIWPALKPLLKK